MIKNIYLFLLFIISCLYSSNSYSLNTEYYDYIVDEKNRVIGRTLKIDTNVQNSLGGADVEDTRSVLNAFSYIPGINALVLPLAYMFQVGIISGVSEGLGSGDVSAISDIAMVGGMITDVLSPSDAESNAAIAIQQTFSTNLYCKHQRFYIEEEEYVSKQKSTSGGGYAMFPIYPMNIPINETNGQCDVGGVIDKYFIDGQLIPQDSKCSYAYSATSDQCIIDLDLPILVEYSATQLTIEGVCSLASISKIAKQGADAAEEMTDKIVEKTTKEMKDSGQEITDEIKDQIKEKASRKAFKSVAKASAEEILEFALKAGVLTGVQLFFDSRLAFDPIMMYSIIQIELAIDFVISFPQDLVDRNWVCIIARVGGIAILDSIVKTTVAVTMATKYSEAKEAIQNITFCGYDWLSYKKTNDEKYYTRGMFEHSRLKNVSDCINDETNCLLTGEIVCNNNGRVDWCEGITAKSKNIKNKLFREYTYGGKEYEVKDRVEDSIKEGDNRYEAMGYDPDYCIDPRLPEYKGFISMAQRYYMKGNEKANFACNRFFYNHNDGCVLPEQDIINEDRNKITIIATENNVNYYAIEKSNTEMFNKYTLACKNAFIEARQCCKYRSRHFVCLENRSNNHNKFCFSNVVDKYGDPENTSLFTYLSTRDADSDKVTCEIDGYKFEATKKEKTNYICVFSDGFCPYNFKLNAGLNYRASYCDANYFSNYKDHSDALKRTTTQYNAADCREGLFSGKMRDEYKKIHSNSGGELLGSYTHYKVRNDMIDGFDYNKDDFTTIYDFNKLVNRDYSGSLFYVDNRGNTVNYVKTNYTAEEIENIKDIGFSKVVAGSDAEKYVLNSLDREYANQIKTSAYGQIKNFCQYRAHCVEVEKERDYAQEFSISALFLDSSCNGSSQHSRNILQTHNGGVPRQLSVPVVECVYESLKNLVNGVAGMSSCADGSVLNVDGYCDDDTKEIVDGKLNQNKLEFFENRYNKYGDTYIIKGTVLPDDYNPFIKLQKYFINIVKTALCLFLVLYSYKKLILIELDILNRKNIITLVRQVAKFSIVAYLVFSNGWRNGIYDYIVNFSTSAYDFVNRMFIKVVQNPKNQILNLDNPNGTVIKVIMEDTITGEETDITMCYRYSFFDNIEFVVKDGTMCEKGFRSKQINEILISNNKNFPKQENNCRLIISNNQEISRLLYYIDEYNKNATQKLKIKVSTSGEKITENSTQCTKRTSWDNIDSVDGGLWNKDYDGCYFDTTEYQNNKQYISFFDTLDCKMMKYLGYSTNSAAPNMLIYSVIMLLPQYFFPNMGILNKIVSGLGSMIFGFMLTFLFLMFNVIVKAVYLFTSSFFILAILIFLSPIILPMMLFKKTKQYYDNWFGQVLGTVLKPSFGLALLILYVNLMDIMLIGNDVVFSNHNNIGRGTDVLCPDNAVSFFCLVNKNPAEAYEILSVIFNGGLLDLLISIIMAFLFFKLSDSFLDELNGIIEKIFKGIGDTSDSTKMSGIHSGGTSDALNKAKSYGKKMEDFRQKYIGDTMKGVLETGLHGTSSEKYDGVLRNTLLNSIDGHINNLGKVGSKISSGIRTKFNENKLTKNESKLKTLEEFNNLKNEEGHLVQQRTKLLQRNKETDGNLFLEEEAELENIDAKLKRLDELTKEVAGFDEKKIQHSIAKEKDRLGIGDGSSGSSRIGEKSENIMDFVSKHMSLDSAGTKLKKYTKLKFKSIGKKITNSKIGTFGKNKYKTISNKLDSYLYGEDKEISYKKANIEFLKKKNEALAEQIYKEDIDEMRKQIEQNSTKIETLRKMIKDNKANNKANEAQMQTKLKIQKEIEDLERKNDQLKNYIDNSAIKQLEDEVNKLRDGDERKIEYGNKINDYKNNINAKKIEFMDNYYAIQKQSKDIEEYYNNLKNNNK